MPVELHALLGPWFQARTLDQAGVLLERQGPPVLVPCRRAVAAIFQDATGEPTPCFVHFETAAHIPQGFRLTSITCKLCRRRQKPGNACVHTAVTTMLTLAGGMPASLRFDAGHWPQVTEFLAEHGTRPEAALRDGVLQWRTRRFLLAMPHVPAILAVATALFPDQVPPAGEAGRPLSHQLAAACREAWNHLVTDTCTTTEAQLLLAGRQSRGQKRDHGFWGLLCRLVALANPEPAWRVRTAADGTVTLEETASGLRLTPDRETTWQLLAPFADDGLVEDLPRARAHARIRLEDDGGLRIEPWVTLPDGRRIHRGELEAHRYGNRYSLDGRGFFAVDEQRPDLTRPENTATTPLLGLLAASEPPRDRTIPAGEALAFLQEHHETILREENDVDPALRQLTIVEVPDSLEITNYREEDGWCYLAGFYRVGDRRIDLADILRLRRAGRNHLFSRDRCLRLAGTPLDRFHAGTERELRLSPGALLALASLVPATATADQAAGRDLLAHRLAAADLDPALLPDHLRAYQRTGVRWLHHLAANGVGGILADDMGLGKTHQALALIDILLGRGEAPILVVCPASVLPHWEHKIASFFPRITCHTHYGGNRDERRLGHAPLLLTTYGVFLRDIASLETIEFAAVFFDEAQHLRNRATKSHKAATRLRARRVYGLTGTPVENSLADLKALCDICLPGLLGAEQTFRTTYQEPIEADGAGAEERRAALRRLLRPFILRRTREQVLTDLPPVIEDVRYCRLSDEQTDLYRQIIEERAATLLAHVERRGTEDFPFVHFLAVVQALKQVCNHPAQLARERDATRYTSGKWDLFVEILDECLQGGHKVVVFSQYTSMLDIIETYLGGRGIGFVSLRGDTPMRARREAVRRFNEEPEARVFCASLLAGGTGIDLTAAAAVIHYDRWWNAAKEEQATARVHRMGQRRVVQVFKLVTAGTLEERIHRLIGEKRELAEDLIQADDASLVKRLGPEDIAALLQPPGTFGAASRLSSPSAA